jgi:aminoglycoside phosphotransferase (APT) family kinase protein
VDAVKAPGPLIATGRDCDIFDYGPGLILRRSREGRSQRRDAEVMAYLTTQGYPVPAVEEISNDGLSLAMQRIEGVTMVEALGKQPWKVRRYGALLAELHQRLHQIPAPDFLPAAPVRPGDRVVHLDLHPLNVMMSPSGPVVIDWTNASLGQPASDVVIAWILMVVGELPDRGLKAALVGRARSALVNSFLAPFDRAPLDACLRDVVTWKTRDAHLSQAEQDHMWRMVASAEKG